MAVRKWHARLMLFGFAAVVCVSSTALGLELTGSVRVHDPSRIHKEGGRYYTFHTGSSNTPIQSKFSDDRTHWQNGAGVFAGGVPSWAAAEVPNGSNAWAPDLIYFNNEYRMYYSFSSFGSQNSVIGLVTNTTLDFTDPNYEWVDQGMVIESEFGFPYNAIDAGIFYDDSTSRMWMSFGSHWNGIYITELNPQTGKLLQPLLPPLNVARNLGSPVNAIEAPFLMKHDDYYYLFVNWDTCCQGSNSTYNIRVGRSTSPTGPFRDRNELAMTSGGGELFLATEGDFIGPGHFSDFSEDNIDYFSYHYYDGDDFGRSKLAIEEFAWTFDGWPVLVSDLPAGDYNRNGVVDAADYTVWRDTLGSTTDLRANGDNSGASANVIDAADYDVWSANLGMVYSVSGALAASGAVPEPSGTSIAWMAVGAIGLLRRRAGRSESALSPQVTRTQN